MEIKTDKQLTCGLFGTTGHAIGYVKPSGRVKHTCLNEIAHEIEDKALV